MMTEQVKIDEDEVGDYLYNVIKGDLVDLI